MTTIDVLFVGGTWNPGGDPVSGAFAAALNPALFRFSMVPYPAAYGDPVPYADSCAIGKRRLLDEIDRSPNPVLLAGYSQGAAIAGDLAAEIGRGEHPGRWVVGCALIADPLRPAGHFIGARDPGGFGIAGQREISGVPAYWAAAPGDPITALPAGNALRTLADTTAYFSIAGPLAAVRWMRAVVDVARRNQLQRWWSPTNRREWGGVIAYARGYLTDGRHTDDYVRNGHAQRLAQVVNRAAVEDWTT